MFLCDRDVVPFILFFIASTSYHILYIFSINPLHLSIYPYSHCALGHQPLPKNHVTGILSYRFTSFHTLFSPPSIISTFFNSFFLSYFLCPLYLSSSILSLPFSYFFSFEPHLSTFSSLLSLVSLSYYLCLGYLSSILFTSHSVYLLSLLFIFSDVCRKISSLII